MLLFSSMDLVLQRFILANFDDCQSNINHFGNALKKQRTVIVKKNVEKMSKQKKENSMNIVELQNNIIRLVLNTDNDQLLYYLNSILQKEDVQPYVFTESEKSIIQESMKYYANGKVVAHDDVISRNEKWLEE